MALLHATPVPVSVIGVLVAGGGVDPLVRDIGFSFIVAGALCVIFSRLRVPTIAAFLAAGVLVGPQLAGVVTDKAHIETIANLGLTLLLFLIGLEINVKKLFASGKTLLITGALQVPLAIAFGWAVVLGLQATGWGPAAGSYIPIYAGFTVAISSTLLVVKILQEKFQLDTVVGRVSLGLLIFQDLWAIVILAVQPNFQNPSLGPVAWTFLGIGIVAGAAVLVAKFVLPRAFHWIAKSPELVLVAATGWCFAVGSFGYHLSDLLHLVGLHAPIRVSMEMCALIAGASIAALPYRHEVVSKVGVVRDFFITLFFVGLGMGIPAPEDASVVLFALILAGLALTARFLVFFPLLYVTGLDRRNAFSSSVKLAQISEFCLVIAYLGQGQGHVSTGFVSSVIFAFVLTALATPFLFRAADPLHERLGGILQRLGFRAPKTHSDAVVEEGPGALVLLGFHRVASSLLWEIQKNRPDILKDVLVVDFNIGLHPDIADTGAKVVYGDIANKEALHHLGLDRAKVILCSIPDDILKGTTNLKLTRMLRELNPNATILVTALGTESAEAMTAAGADYAFLPRVETARNLLTILDAAFSGNLEAYKREEAEDHGTLSSRREILP